MPWHSEMIGGMEKVRLGYTVILTKPGSINSRVFQIFPFFKLTKYELKKLIEF